MDAEFEGISTKPLTSHNQTPNIMKNTISLLIETLYEWNLMANPMGDLETFHYSIMLDGLQTLMQ